MKSRNNKDYASSCMGYIGNVGFEKLSDFAETVMNRIYRIAHLRTLKRIMKNDAEVMSKAYQSLGRAYFDSLSDEEKQKSENKIFCDIIAKSKKRINKANILYMETALGEDFDFEVPPKKPEEDFKDYSEEESPEIKAEPSSEEFAQEDSF